MIELGVGEQHGLQRDHPVTAAGRVQGGAGSDLSVDVG